MVVVCLVLKFQRQLFSGTNDGGPNAAFASARSKASNPSAPCERQKVLVHGCLWSPVEPVRSGHHPALHLNRCRCTVVPAPPARFGKRSIALSFTPAPFLGRSPSDKPDAMVLRVNNAVLGPDITVRPAVVVDEIQDSSAMRRQIHTACRASSPEAKRSFRAARLPQ